MMLDLWPNRETRRGHLQYQNRVQLHHGRCQCIKQCYYVLQSSSLCINLYICMHPYIRTSHGSDSIFLYQRWANICEYISVLGTSQTLQTVVHRCLIWRLTNVHPVSVVAFKPCHFRTILLHICTLRCWNIRICHKQQSVKSLFQIVCAVIMPIFFCNANIYGNNVWYGHGLDRERLKEGEREKNNTA